MPWGSSHGRDPSYIQLPQLKVRVHSECFRTKLYKVRTICMLSLTKNTHLARQITKYLDLEKKKKKARKVQSLGLSDLNTTRWTVATLFIMLTAWVSPIGCYTSIPVPLSASAVPLSASAVDGAKTVHAEKNYHPDQQSSALISPSWTRIETATSCMLLVMIWSSR